MSALDRIRAAEVIAPEEHSTTRFVPFVQITESDRDALVAAYERLRDALTRSGVEESS